MRFVSPSLAAGGELAPRLLCLLGVELGGGESEGSEEQDSESNQPEIDLEKVGGKKRQLSSLFKVLFCTNYDFTYNFRSQKLRRKNLTILKD